ncbi:MAG TPA: CcmD family protein [Candidatus Binataceae bacterium]|jgi:CcmD family protein
MDHFPYLFAAYTLIFLAIFLYVAFLWRRQSRLVAEIDLLQSELKALRDKGRAAGSAVQGGRAVDSENLGR